MSQARKGIFKEVLKMFVFTTIFGQWHIGNQPKPANVRTNDCAAVAPRTGNEDALPS